MKELIKKLSYIQKELKAPKNQNNSFGGYNYRSCEDILEAIKPHLDENTLVTLSDEIINIGNRYYVKATATFYHGDNKLEVTAKAREAESRKKMDDSQCTGSSSSYARKYALNGLFLIDDAKDPDTNEFCQNAQNGNPQGNRNNTKQRNNKPNDKTTKELRNLISNITNNFKDKTKVQIICQHLNIKDLSQIANFNYDRKRQTIDYLRRTFQNNNKRKN